MRRNLRWRGDAGLGLPTRKEGREEICFSARAFPLLWEYRSCSEIGDKKAGPLPNLLSLKMPKLQREQGKKRHANAYNGFAA